MPIPATNPPTAASRLRYIAALEDMLAKRTRLTIAAAIIGLTAGFLLHMTIAAPPVWIDEVTTACTQ